MQILFEINWNWLMIKKSKIELSIISKELLDIINLPLPWIIRTGNIVLFFLMFVSLFIAYSIKYPRITQGQGTIISSGLVEIPVTETSLISSFNEDSKKILIKSTTSLQFIPVALKSVKRNSCNSLVLEMSFQTISQTSKIPELEYGEKVVIQVQGEKTKLISQIL